MKQQKLKRLSILVIEFLAFSENDISDSPISKVLRGHAQDAPLSPEVPAFRLISACFTCKSGHLKMLPKTLTITKVENTIIVPLVILNVT